MDVDAQTVTLEWDENNALVGCIWAEKHEDVPVSCLSAMGMWRNDVVLTAATSTCANNVCHSPLTYSHISFFLNRRIVDTRARSSPGQLSWGDASHVRPTLLTIFVLLYAVFLTL